MTVSVAVADVVPRFALIVAVVFAPTAIELIVNVALVAPAATVTEVGVVALELLDERETTAPPVGAAPFKVTVPVEELPPTTDVGLSETD